jgi:thymidine kinase
VIYIIDDNSIIQYPDLMMKPFNSLIGQSIFLTGPMRAAKTAYLNILVESFRSKMFQEGFFAFATKIATDKRSHGHEPPDLDPLHYYSSLGGSVQIGVFPFATTENLAKNYEIYTNLSKDHFGQPRLVIFVDEVQFADNQFPDLVSRIKDDGHTLLIGAGLNKGFRAEPWSTMIQRYTDLTDKVIELDAVCEIKAERCLRSSQLTQRYSNGTPSHWAEKLELVGGVDSYSPACISCWECPGKETADDIRDILVDNPDIEVNLLYSKLEKHHPLEEIKLDLYRMYEEGAVEIKNINTEKGSLLRMLGEVGKKVITDEKEFNSKTIEGGNAVYKGVLTYKL